MRSHRFQRRHSTIALAALLMVNAPGMAGEKEKTFLPNMRPFDNATGAAATFSPAGKIDLTGPFFQSMGTNGRACVTCHQPSIGWTVTPQNIQARFDATNGTDPIFRTNDGSNSPTADVSTVEARRSAYSMLLNLGLGKLRRTMVDLNPVEAMETLTAALKKHKTNEELLAKLEKGA